MVTFFLQKSNEAVLVFASPMGYLLASHFALAQIQF